MASAGDVLPAQPLALDPLRIEGWKLESILNALQKVPDVPPTTQFLQADAGSERQARRAFEMVALDDPQLIEAIAQEGIVDLWGSKASVLVAICLRCCEQEEADIAKEIDALSAKAKRAAAFAKLASCCLNLTCRPVRTFDARKMSAYLSTGPAGKPKTAAVGKTTDVADPPAKEADEVYTSDSEESGEDEDSPSPESKRQLLPLHVLFLQPSATSGEERRLSPQDLLVSLASELPQEELRMIMENEVLWNPLKQYM